MDEDEDRCRGPFRAVDVEALDLAWSIGEALGLADAQACLLAVSDPALDQLLAV